MASRARSTGEWKCWSARRGTKIAKGHDRQVIGWIGCSLEVADIVTGRLADGPGRKPGPAERRHDAVAPIKCAVLILRLGNPVGHQDERLAPGEVDGIERVILL